MVSESGSLRRLASDTSTSFAPIFCPKRRLVEPLVTVLLMLACGAIGLPAQTAHFSSAQATIANEFYVPWGVAVDSVGNIFVSDNGNRAVKEILAVNGRIPASPTIRTIASGFSQNAGLAVDRAGNIFVGDLENSSPGAVKEVLAVNGTIPDSPTVIEVGGEFNYPFGVATDSSGDVYVADSENTEPAVDEILAVNGAIPASPTIREWSGAFDSPSGVAVDRNGNVYVANMLSHSVQEILAVNGTIPDTPTIEVLGTGFWGPKGLAVDNSGNVYVADSGYNEIYEMLAVNGSIPASPTIRTLGPGFANPEGVALDANGNVIISDTLDDQIVKLSTSGWDFGQFNVGTTSPEVPLTFTFDTAGTLGSTAVLTQGATGLDFNDAGGGTCQANTAYSTGQTCTVNVSFSPKFAGVRYGATVLKDTNGNVIATGYVQGIGVGPQVSFFPGHESAIISGLSAPIGVALDGNGNIYASQNHGGLLKETMSGGSYTQTTIAMGTGTWDAYLDAVDGAGNVYVADVANGEVIKASPTSTGYSQSVVDSGFGYPYGVAVDGSGNVFIADNVNNQILKETPSGTGYTRSTAINNLSSPMAVAVDGSGNLYIAETSSGSGSLVKATPSAGGGYYLSALPVTGNIVPQSVAVDGTGNVYFEDASTNNIYREALTTNGYVESLAVSDLQTPIGPYGLAVDGSGNLYVAYPSKGQIIKVDYADPPTLSFASTPVGSTSADSPQTVTVENTGNADLTFPIPSTGNNPSISSNFTLDGNAPNACPIVGSGSSSAGTLAAGNSCALSISFAPTSVGTIGGSLVLTDNNLNAVAPGYAQQSISLSGTGQATPAVLLSPTPGTTLGSSATFSWTTGSGVSYYVLNMSTIGPGGTDLYSSGHLTTTSTGPVPIPANGVTVFARLFSRINGAYQYYDYTFTEPGQATPAVLLSPTPGTTLGSSATFSWTTGSGVSYYVLNMSTIGPGGTDLYSSGHLTTTSTGPVPIPANGVTVFARLFSRINGAYQYYDYSFTEP